MKRDIQNIITFETKHLRRFYSARQKYHIEFSPKKCPEQSLDLIERHDANRNFLDCFNKHLNESFGCIYQLFFRVERDIKYFGYKLCNNAMFETHLAQNSNMIRDIKLIKQRCHDAY